MRPVLAVHGQLLAPLLLVASLVAAVPLTRTLTAPSEAAGSGGSGTSQNVVLVLTQAQAAALLRVDLGPEALSAAGLTPVQAKTVIDAGKVAAKTQASAVADADAAVATHRAQLAALSAKVRSGLSSPEEVTELAATKASLASAEAARVAVLDAVWTAGTQGLESSPREVLATIRTNSDWSLPVAYLSVEREEAAWVQLRNVLDQKQVCEGDGVELDSPCASYLAGIESDATVAAALAGISTHHASLQASWDAALSGS